MKSTRAVIRRHGGPEAVIWEEVDCPAPGPGEVLMRNEAVGLNMIDTYHRSGLYPVALPSGLGVEAAGLVETVGEGVDHVKPGDRVVTFGPVLGAYSTARCVPAAGLFVLPDGISFEVAAASFLKGCTTEFLVERCGEVEAGWSVLVHAAAGATGQLLVRWLKHVGASVVATTSTEEKAAIAHAAGADHVIRYGETDVAAAVRDLTGGEGVRVVFDGVGRATWQASLESLRKRGLMISFGNASGAVGKQDIASLAQKGSLFATRPTLFDYYADPVEAKAGAARLFALIEQGVIDVDIGQTYALTDAAQAHTDLEARRTTGSTLLLP
ncbi:MAG: quinone oxidoreductase [Pacificimonas sp.]